jgi:hypothetical protein
VLASHCRATWAEYTKAPGPRLKAKGKKNRIAKGEGRKLKEPRRQAREKLRKEDRRREKRKGDNPKIRDEK